MYRSVSHKAFKKDNDATMIVLPSDHFIEGEKEFRDTILQAVEITERKRGLITIGVNPTRPETGYGYIEMGERIAGDISTYKVERFTEKPNLEVAMICLRVLTCGTAVCLYGEQMYFLGRWKNIFQSCIKP